MKTVLYNERGQHACDGVKAKRDTGQRGGVHDCQEPSRGGVGR